MTMASRPQELAAIAVGLVLYFTGAVILHVRHAVYAKVVFPAPFLVLAIASLAVLM
jgi:DoxX-like family